ncbi:MAG: glycosyltransferase family 4 protein [bacterium]|nr:glycosyltransferase family 4 protein [bacterium]
MGKIKILHLRNSYQRAEVLFGAEKIIFNIFRGIDKDKFMPILAMLTDKRAKSDLPLKRDIEQLGMAAENIYLNNKFDANAVQILRENLKRHEVDILHCHDYKSDIIAFLALRIPDFRDKIKIISTVHGYLGERLNLKIYEYMDRHILKYFDRVVAVSDALVSYLERTIDSSLLSMVPNAIDVEEFRATIDSEKVKKEFSIDKETLVVGTIGRLSVEKGHVYLLKAAKKICEKNKKVKFIIVGDGPIETKLKKWVCNNCLSDKVIFTGSRKEIKEVLSIFDVFVLPSKKEAFGLAILEAMASSKPVIATDVGGVSSIINSEEIGVLIKPKDVNSMMSAILELLNNKKRRLSVGAKAKNYVFEKYSLVEMIKSYETLYGNLIS